jgi:two-component system chemotaxis sensor kinase CheA
MTAQERQIQAEIDSLVAADSWVSGAEQALARIVQLSASLPETASLAGTLLEQIRDAEGTADLDSSLRAGLLRLQEAVRRELKPPEPPADNLADDPELIADFVAESREHLSSIEANLLALEKDPSLTDAVHSVFRSFHTIKGLAGFLGLGPIQAVAHETETLLDHAREKRIAITPRLIDITLKSADYVKAALNALVEKPPDEAMRSLRSNQGLLLEISAGESAELPPAEAVAEALPAPDTGAPAPTARRADGNTVRVNTAKLEYLVEMVGELVIAQSLIHFSPENDAVMAAGLSRNFAHLGRVTAEIQRTAMSMRMVPISRLFDKMDRLVRDLARKAGKRIELRRIGDHVELDRNLIEEITDPVVHMIRNSVDHGIEDAAVRQASRKNETAAITLEAFHQGGFINLRISDDGRGLDAEKICEKAVRKGLIPPETRPDEQSIFKLIFEPGFSTAEKVTSISGRGVGMDVVRRQIEKLRGTVHVDSKPGVGCAFTLKVPLTLAMVDGLILESAGERYVLPLYSVREMFHITEDKLFTVENRSEMVLLRGSLLPVMRLDRFFGRVRQEGSTGEIGVVVEGRSRQFCMAVDRLLGKQEVVIKALGACFCNVAGVAGGAILGDGRVGLILDIHGFGGGNDSES